MIRSCVCILLRVGRYGVMYLSLNKQVYLHGCTEHLQDCCAPHMILLRKRITVNVFS